MILIIWMFGGLIGYAAAQRKGFSAFAGVVGGILLGPLAFLMFFISGVNRGDSSKKCPRCAEFVKAEALVCKHCGGSLTPVAPEAAS